MANGWLGQIAGESTGRGSVLVHLASPPSRGLFNRAILESPGIPCGRAGSGPLSLFLSRLMVESRCLDIRDARSGHCDRMWWRETLDQMISEAF
jgi:carboxylesterase type B